jgi:hypothetical protein
MNTTLVTELRRRLWVLRDSVRHRLLGKEYRRRLFARIHAGNLWGDPESVSGTGSSLSATTTVRRELPDLMRRFDCHSLLDAPCGDFVWMKTIAHEMERYVGVDIVDEVIARNRAAYAGDRIAFVCADLVSDPLPTADMILCRDCFIHLPTRSIEGVLRNFKRTGARYLLLTNCPGASPYHDIALGSFRKIDFTQAPFRFPRPVAVIQEEENRELALWDLQALSV